MKRGLKELVPLMTYRRSAVEENSPMKRGLKVGLITTPCSRNSVEENSPMKRGLKVYKIQYAGDWLAELKRTPR